MFFRGGLGLTEYSVGAYKGRVSAVRGIRGFIWSGDSAARRRERTQSIHCRNHFQLRPDAFAGGYAAIEFFDFSVGLHHGERASEDMEA